MSELTIEQLKFAREIGATHARKQWYQGLFRNVSKTGYEYWNRAINSWVNAQSPTLACMVEIDFSPLDDNEASPKPIPAPDYNPADVAFKSTSDGSTASYYELPTDCTQLQDLISYRNMNAQDGEIFRVIYRKGRASHSDALRDAKKVLFYAQAEVERLQRYME